MKFVIFLTGSIWQQSCSHHQITGHPAVVQGTVTVNVCWCDRKVWSFTVLFVSERQSVGVVFRSACVRWKPQLCFMSPSTREGEDVRAVNSLPRMPFCPTCHQARLTDTPGGWMVMSALPRQQRRVEYVRVVGRGGGGERRQRRRVCLSKCEGRRSGERSANDVFTSWKSRDSKRLLFINPEAEKNIKSWFRKWIFAIERQNYKTLHGCFFYVCTEPSNVNTELQKFCASF